MMRYRILRRALALLLVPLLPACYSYVPLESGSPRAGDDVRVHLTEEVHSGPTVARLDEQGDPYVRGLVLGSRSDSLTLSVRSEAARRTGVGFPVLRDTLTLAGSEIRRIDRNQLDALRTTVLAGLGAGAVATAVILVINADPSGSSGIGDGGGPRAAVQIPIRIPVGAP